jgi:hypothetical protein
MDPFKVSMEQKLDCDDFDPREKRYMVKQCALASFSATKHGCKLFQKILKKLITALEKTGAAGPLIAVVNVLQFILDMPFVLIGCILGAVSFMCTYLIGSYCYRFRKVEIYYVMPMHASRCLLALEKASQAVKKSGEGNQINDPVKKLLDPLGPFALEDVPIQVTYRFSMFYSSSWKRFTSMFGNPVSSLFEVTALEKPGNVTHLKIQSSWADPLCIFRCLCSAKFFPPRSAMKVFGERLLLTTCQAAKAKGAYNSKYNVLTDTHKAQLDAVIKTHRSSLLKSGVSTLCVVPTDADSASLANQQREPKVLLGRQDLKPKLQSKAKAKAKAKKAAAKPKSQSKMKAISAKNVEDVVQMVQRMCQDEVMQMVQGMCEDEEEENAKSENDGENEEEADEDGEDGDEKPQRGARRRR